MVTVRTIYWYDELPQRASSGQPKFDVIRQRGPNVPPVETELNAQARSGNGCLLRPDPSSRAGRLCEAPPPAAAVKVDAVSKSYHLGKVEVPALNDVSLTIRSGIFAFVVGPSGSGKTTLLNLIGCIDQPDRGSVWIRGQNSALLSENERSDFRAKTIGFIFQSFNLIPVLSTYENVEYPLLLTAVGAKERRERTRAMLDAVGLTAHRDHRPNELSGGQRQRVAIARALIKEPSLLLADEPTANLDSHTGEAIVSLMRSLQERAKTTFIFSSHDPQLMEHAQETFVLRDGRIVDYRTNV